MAAAMTRVGLGGAGLMVLALALATGGWARETTPPGSAGTDPTRPPDRVLKQQQAPAGTAGLGSASLADPGKLVLQAILQSDGRPSRVMIDGWLYRTGDIVHGFKLTSINRDSAEFDAEGKKLRISLTPQASITIAKSAEPVSPLTVKPVRPPARPMPKERQ